MGKKIYFLRHGQADWPNWDKPDEERPLNKKGIKETRKVAKFLGQLGIIPDIILTSPLPRALETAQIAARELEVPIMEVPALMPCSTPEGVFEMVAKYGEKSTMLVGHEPDFSNLVGALTGARLKLAKSGVARVDLESGEERGQEQEESSGWKGKLIWLIPPKLVKT